MAEKGYSARELLLSAIKGEKLASRLYATLAKRSKNPYLKDRLVFLSKEEAKHREMLERMLERNYGDRHVGPFKLLMVPLRVVEAPSSCTDEAEFLASAMETEMAAEEFYTELAKTFPPESDEAWLLSYFAIMEKSHYQLLANEKFFSESHDYRKMRSMILNKK
jgi:rubrerythrin